MAVKMIWKAVFGPCLYGIYQIANEPTHPYQSNAAESFAGTIIKWVSFFMMIFMEIIIKLMKVCWSVCVWGSPVILPIMYRRGAFTAQGLVTLSTYGAGFSVLLCLAILVRTFGRLTNPEYRTFLRVLIDAQNNFNSETKKQLLLYDSDINDWPVDFDVAKIGGDGSKRRPIKITAKRGLSLANGITSIPMNILSFICVHTFGRRMLYPGSLSLIQSMMAPHLMLGRAKLVEENHGIRAKLRTSDRNDIDTMFVDRRSVGDQCGQILVICSEGNSGYYEVGCMVTPLEAGYSVLGWNHPGFWGSTGAPYPDQEQNAMDAVVQYAINKLGFEPNNIVLFAWSIGGYAATWAAMAYPDIRSVVLDATFDDIKPLAIAKMPPSWKSLVQTTISKYLNLNNAEQLCKYPGPVLLIRRSKDEMITTSDSTVISSNRGNDFLMQLLQHRYPYIVDDSTILELRQWLSTDKSGQVQLMRNREVDVDECSAIFQSYFDANSSSSYPSLIGQNLSHETKVQLTLFLANKHMEDYDSTHCTPLPADRFHEPWSPWSARLNFHNNYSKKH